jgi:hypothetical protein
MRFLSHIRNFGVGILQSREEVLAGGVTREIQPMLTATFKTGDIFAEELEYAERHFKVHGRTTERDEVTLTPLIGRLSTYDTESEENIRIYDEIDAKMEGTYLPGGREKWTTGSTKKLVEEKLLSRQGENYALVEQAPVDAPWPKYDEFQGDDESLVFVLVEQGHNLGQAIAYERQHQNRPDVIRRLEEAVQEQAAETGVPVGMISG